MRVSVFFIFMFLCAVVTNTAHAGDRAYYVGLVELGIDAASPETVSHYVALKSALLGCDSTEAACMRNHTNEDRAMETESNIALRQLPGAITNDVVEGVIANRAASRRAFAAATSDTDLDGILVVKMNARGVMHVYTLRRNGTIWAHTRYRPSATGPIRANVRSVMLPIQQAFVP